MPEVTQEPTEKKGHSLSDLTRFYSESESADAGMFAEMRSALLLVAGEHYARKDSAFYRRIRDARDLSKEQKLRLTKNHVRKICQVYANNIIAPNPGVGFTPKDDSSTHDQKAAELHHSVWRDAHERYDLDDKIDDWVDSFCQIGEVHCKIFYDPMAGKIDGYHPKVDELGQSVLNEMGEEIPDETKPVPTGAFVFEEVYGFNLLRPKECKDLRMAEWLGVRKMANLKDMKLRWGAENSAFATSTSDETYKIFDISNGGYRDSSTEECMVIEYYFRPCLSYPQGYFYYTTKSGIFAQGELPGGLFPIVSTLFDRMQTTPRGVSPVKAMRPYQAEINRGSSKMAEHQITLGDDKLLIQNGTKVSAGASLPGVRAVNYTGSEPKVLAGRDGAQYLSTITQNITELYQVMNVAEDMQEQDTGQLDAYTLLFRSAHQKKKFQRYIKRFEKYLIQLVKLYLQLAKIHLPDDAVIYAIGKNEQVNIEEFRMLSDICYEVNIEAQSDDIESKLGKQIALNHTLQYVGTQLDKDDIGKIIQQMPYVNADKSFDDLTINDKIVTNVVLALDRGEKPPVNQYDKHAYQIERLTFRTTQPDFQYLSPQIQTAYFSRINLHEQFEAQRMLRIQRAEQGFIPTGGYLVACDFYVKDPSDKTGVKTRRARVPYQSIEWLMQQLEAQGLGQEELGSMNGVAQAEVGDMISSANSNPSMPKDMGMQG